MAARSTAWHWRGACRNCRDGRLVQGPLGGYQAVRETGEGARGQQEKGSQESAEEGSSNAEHGDVPSSGAGSAATASSARPKRARRRAQSDGSAKEDAEAPQQEHGRRSGCAATEIGAADSDDEAGSDEGGRPKRIRRQVEFPGMVSGERKRARSAEATAPRTVARTRQRTEGRGRGGGGALRMTIRVGRWMVNRAEQEDHG